MKISIKISHRFTWKEKRVVSRTFVAQFYTLEISVILMKMDSNRLKSNIASASVGKKSLGFKLWAKLNVDLSASGL